jgi:hypothetical protein
MGYYCIKFLKGIHYYNVVIYPRIKYRIYKICSSICSNTHTFTDETPSPPPSPISRLSSTLRNDFNRYNFKNSNSPNIDPKSINISSVINTLENSIKSYEDQINYDITKLKTQMPEPINISIDIPITKQLEFNKNNKDMKYNDKNDTIIQIQPNYNNSDISDEWDNIDSDDEYCKVDDN